MSSQMPNEELWALSSTIMEDIKRDMDIESIKIYCYIRKYIDMPSDIVYNIFENTLTLSQMIDIFQKYQCDSGNIYKNGYIPTEQEYTELFKGIPCLNLRKQN